GSCLLPRHVARLRTVCGRQPPSAALSPYTTLFRSQLRHADRRGHHRPVLLEADVGLQSQLLRHHVRRVGQRSDLMQTHVQAEPGDRKSTRLNSSHVKISYAVFCLKKKTSSRPCWSP